MPTRYLTVNYRKASPIATQTLEEMLRECLEHEVQPGIRFSQAPAARVMVHDQGGRELLLNEFADVTDGVAGIICEVAPGQLQPVLNRTASEKQLTVKTVSKIFQIADQAAGTDQDFVQGLCYFYVRHNHLLFVTVKGFRKIDVQPFMNWLLAKMSKGNSNLNAAVDRSQVGDDIGRISRLRTH